MPNNFRKRAVLKKIRIVNLSFTPKNFTQKTEGVTCARRPRITFLQFLYTLYTYAVCKKAPGKIKDKCVENLKQASGEI